MYSDTISDVGMYRSAEQINSAMVRVYNHMFMAVIASMITSAVVSTSPALMAFFFTGVMKWITIFAPLAVLLIMGFAQERFDKRQLQMFLMGFSVLMGLSMSSLFVIFTLGSIVSAFMGAAVLFGTMSFYGYFTRRDLTSLGQFMFVGLIAIVIASIINIFIGSSAMAMVVSALAIVIFMGLTAYDTQNIRNTVSMENDGRMEVLGALSLYLNFVNMFTALLQLFGNRE